MKGRFPVRKYADLVMVSAWGSRSCSVARTLPAEVYRPGIGNPVTLGSTVVFDVEEL